MKKVTLMAIAILFAGTSAFAAHSTTASDTSKTKKTKTTTTKTTAKVQYTCPMHHDVLSDKPGKCPKPHCGMTLVKVDPTKKPATMKM
jgi:hypothetical protein